MFAGALVGTETPAADKGYASADFGVVGNAYPKANYATFHKFRY
jgi:hypothetical protein